MNTSILHLAQYLVNECVKFGSVTPLKLQKLLYYVKAWGHVAGYALVQEHFHKWNYGPVNTQIYHAFKEYGDQPIPQKHVAMEPTGPEKELIDVISTCYAQYNAVTLSAMTHKEDPWRDTSKDQVIPAALMQAFYQKQPFAKNFPFDPDKGPFYLPETDVSAAFTMDMSEEEADQVTTYSSYRAYLQHLNEVSVEYDRWKMRFFL